MLTGKTVSNVFISYRHRQPDDRLARALSDYLNSRGNKVFLDAGIRLGTVREEVRMAHDRKQAGRTTILPIRFAGVRELPYDLGAWLNPVQYVRWDPADPTDIVCRAVQEAIQHGTPLPEPGTETAEVLRHPTEPEGAPLPAADPRIVMEAGAVRLDSPFYVKRPEDSVLERDRPPDSPRSRMRVRPAVLVARTGRPAGATATHRVFRPSGSEYSNHRATLLGRLLRGHPRLLQRPGHGSALRPDQLCAPRGRNARPVDSRSGADAVQHRARDRALGFHFLGERNGEGRAEEVIDSLVRDLFFSEAVLREDLNLHPAAARLTHGGRRARRLLQLYRQVREGTAVPDKPAS
jgi:hypothetical protein